MKRYYITDRRPIGGLNALRKVIAQALADHVEMIQIREKDLEARVLWEFARSVRQLPNPGGTRLLISGRVDIALAAGLDGVHLPSLSISAAEWRKITPPGFLIGTSVHSLAEIDREADFAVVSPVFETASKPDYGPALGPAGLARIIQQCPVPVYALGGITEANAPECLAAGAAGIAGISLFQKAFSVDLLK